MTEARVTAISAGAALTLLLLTWITTPRIGTPAIFADRGQSLFPQFQDPNSAASLEVLEFDAQNATVRPFKVQARDGRWTIPSQHDYPADARDRVAGTAAAIIALKKEDFVSDNATDYQRCGVLDPLDTTSPALTGRGRRLIVRDKHDQLLADVIIGNQVEGHSGLRYARIPSQRRVYVSYVGDLKVSTALGDWIDRDLLQVNADEIDAVNLRNYSLDRSTGRLNPGETLLLQKSQDHVWTLNGMKSNEQLDSAALEGLLSNLASLKITSVLPKPTGITATLSSTVSDAKVTPEDRADLARKGFYLAADGQLASNRGEVIVRTSRGLYYTLRFGDVALGVESSADDVSTPGVVTSKPTPARENRYLFIMVNFDPRSAVTPGRAAEGAEKAEFLRARFAPWYYVIAAESFAGIRLQRRDLVKR